MDLIVTGLSHKTAPLAAREQLAFSGEETFAFLKQIKAEKRIREALLLSTCNRTELYACVPHADMDRAGWLQDYLSDYKKPERPLVDDSFYSHSESYAVRHLFRVASGLESLAVGENQILGQVKQAYHLCCEARANGVVLNKLLHRAFRVGKRARSETAIGVGAVSVSGAAAEMARATLGDLEGRAVLLVGAGETGRLAAEALRKRGASQLTIVNRTLTRAEDLAQETAGTALPWEQMEAALASADVVICCTRAEGFALESEQLARARQGVEKPLLALDIAVPRNVDPTVAELPGVTLCCVDDLEATVAANQESRQDAVRQVEAVVEEETEKFLQWHRTLKLTPVITGLRGQFEKIRQAEMAKHGGCLNGELREQVDRMTRAMINAMLDTPMAKLREFNEDSQMGMARLDTIREVFELYALEEDHAD